MRSAIPWSPVPRDAAAGSNPRPSSMHLEREHRRRSARDGSIACDASAYLATFCSASRQREVHGGLDLLRVATDPVGLDRDRHDRLPGLGSRARPRAPCPRAAADRSRAPGPGGLRAPAFVSDWSCREHRVRPFLVLADQRVRQLELHRQRDQLLLCAVVDVALDPSALLVLGGDEPLARRAELLDQPHACEGPDRAWAARSATSRSFEPFIGSRRHRDGERTQQLDRVRDAPRLVVARARTVDPDPGAAGRPTGPVGQCAAGRSRSPTRSHTVARSRPIPVAEHLRHARQHVVGGVRLADAAGERGEDLVRCRPAAEDQAIGDAAARHRAERPEREPDQHAGRDGTGTRSRRGREHPGRDPDDRPKHHRRNTARIE